MRAHLVQPDTSWERRDENFRLIDRMLSEPGVAGAIRPGDLVVLPEMFDSGFSMATERTADRDGAAASFLHELADDLGCTVAGGRTVRACTQRDCAATNRLTVFGPRDRPGPGARAAGPDGNGGTELLADYAKVHPFTFGEEHRSFSAGHEIAVFPWRPAPGDAARPLQLCAAVCYDLRFPELFRLGMASGAEGYIVAANWPAPRHRHWQVLTCARAVENQAYVFAVNRCGEDPNQRYLGGTAAIAPDGTVLGELGDAPGVLSVDIDPAAPAELRERFPVLGDARLLDWPAAATKDDNAPRAADAETDHA